MLLFVSLEISSSVPSLFYFTPQEEAHLNFQTLGFYLYGTERVYLVFVVGLILFVAMVSAICLSLVGGENYRTQELYSQIRRSNGIFNFNSSSLRKKTDRSI